MREFLSKLFRKPARLSDELREEMESHIEIETRENIERGMDPTCARIAARQKFGSVTAVAESARDSWTFPPLETFVQDIRYAVRGMFRAPGFSLVVVLTLALGIGATTAIFCAVNSVLLKPLPYPDAERLVWMGESTGKATGISVTWQNYRQWRESNHTFEDMAAYEGTQMTLTGRGDASLAAGMSVTSNFFTLTGMRPFAGRLLDQADDRSGSPRTIVLSHKFWMERFGGDRTVVGTALLLNGRPYEVVGIAAPAWSFFGRAPDYFCAMGSYQSGTAPRNQHGSMRVLGKLKPGVALATGRADIDAVMQHLAQTDPGPENDHRVYAKFLIEETTSGSRSTLLMVMGAVGLILIIACANVTSLVLARSMARSGEMAVRSAIGAGRMRLLRQVLTENLLLSAIGGGAGLLLATWGLRGLIRLAPRGVLPRLAEISLDWHVFLFAALLTTVTGLVIGMVPIFAAGKCDLVANLKDSTRSSTSTKRTQRIRNAMVVAEVAITLVLAFTSGLLLRSLISAQNAHPGFAPEHLLALQVRVAGADYKTGAATAAYYENLATQLKLLPGVESVGTVCAAPSSGTCADWWYTIADRPAPARADVPLALMNFADPGYFKTAGITLREGRAFAATDRKGAPPVVIVNETLARSWWPNGGAVGHRIKMGGPYMDGEVVEIVGVAADVSQQGVDTQPLPEIFLAMAQRPQNQMYTLIRTGGDPAQLAPSVRKVVTALDRNQPVRKLQPVEKTLAASLERRRFGTLLLSMFAGLAMLLAAVGMYGLLTYWVNIKESEIALRMALGASRIALVRWTGSHAMRLAALGIGLGLLGSLWAAGAMDSLVFGVAPRSPAGFIAASAAVLLIAAVATVLPAWRATRVDPAKQLKC